VLSTSVGARGIAGLRAGEQLLIADDAEAFVKNLELLITSPETLTRLSRAGREFYERNQSRGAVARHLSQYLQQYFGIATDSVESFADERKLDRVPA
jgi:hypothetical protein